MLEEPMKNAYFQPSLSNPPLDIRKRPGISRCGMVRRLFVQQNHPGFSGRRIERTDGSADVVLNTKLFGFVTDISKTYGESAGTNLNTLTFLVEPRFARHGKKITWFVHSLYGFSSISADGDIFGPKIGRYDS